MKVLVIGSGGREHAIVWKLAQSEDILELICAPGNVAMGEERLRANGERVRLQPISATDLDGVTAYAEREQVDLVVVAPDDPLGMGMVDQLQAAGIRAWGPNQSAARFESSKAFAQAFMDRHGIPTAKSGAFTDVDAALDFVDSLGGKCAVKVDGLALGKGVFLCENSSEAKEALDKILVQRSFGEAGSTVVIQEFLEGIEVSLHAFCDGSTTALFPSSQDHKRAYDGDQGPNTGGMGTYSPAPFLSDQDIESIQKTILDPWLKGCKEEGILYQGILYPGIILTQEGPKVLEFNSRFGDPETQVYLPRMQNDLLDVMEACLDGELDQVTLEWADEACVCVVMASGGYPGNYEKGKVIHGISEAEQSFPGQVKVFLAGVKLNESESDWVTNGGRVLGVTALGSDLSQAREIAYKAAEQISFEGAMMRSDIANKALV